jgi:5-methylthioribose kinase
MIPDDEARDVSNALVAMGLAEEQQHLAITRLSGGVSCDVYEVDVGGTKICVKRALPKLRVKADWQAPAERSSAEVAWMKLANKIAPGRAPKILGEDPARHMFAMEFFPPEKFPVWKAKLAAGQIDADFAGRVGGQLVFLHSSTIGRRDVEKNFANDAQFLALRLDPFLLHVARKHTAVSAELRAAARGVSRARIALMHGDVSPKNILVGPGGPVFLDAETACYGDPAFDLAFCLNHLLLKCVWHPEWTEAYLKSFSRLRSDYFAGITWEATDAFERRAARLLPGLLLARVDGKSPADYLTSEAQQFFVRVEAIEMLKAKFSTLESIATRWRKAIAKAPHLKGASP